MQSECSRAVPVAIFLRQPLKVKQVGAAHQTLDPGESRVLGGSRRTLAVVLILAADETPQCLALFVVGAGDVRQPFDVRQLVLAAQPNRAVLGTQPAGPVACLKTLELIPLRAGVEQNEIWDGAVELPQLLAKHRAQRGSHERWARLVSPVQQIDGGVVVLEVGLHRAHHRELVHDLGTIRHQLTDVIAGQRGGDAFERPTGDSAGLGIPALELAGPTAEPKQDTAFLFALGLLGKHRVGKQAGPTRGGDGTHATAQPLKKTPPMQPVFGAAALIVRLA